MTDSPPAQRPRRDPMAGAPRVAAHDRPATSVIREQRAAAAKPYRNRGADARTAADVKA